MWRNESATRIAWHPIDLFHQVHSPPEFVSRTPNPTAARLSQAENQDMSEYQYYEWQSVDRLLTDADQSAVSALSSHIDVSASQAVVTY